MTWSYSQALNLAPDEASRKNAVSLISSRKWLRLSVSQVEERLVLWGEVQGSGASPYRCQVDPGGPAFGCTCPSKKRPCKHALAMLLIYASQPERFETCAAPDWASVWLTRQVERGLQRAARVEGRGSIPDAFEKERKLARRVSARDRNIRAGMDALEIWLQDLLRQGLAAAQTRPKAFWENMSARLVDAQAPGLARMVRMLPGLAVSGAGWQDRLLEQIARLYLAIEGYRRIDGLPEENQADLRNLVGIHLKQAEIRDDPGVQDVWLVMGQEIEEEADLKTQRTWLWGETTGQPALVLSFAAGNASLDMSLAPGVAVLAELVFYPGAFPLRALVRKREDPQPLSLTHLSGVSTFQETTTGFASALARYPWLERYPIILNQVIPFRDQNGWMVADQQGRRAPLLPTFLHSWTLLALSGGNPIGIFGEWNGENLLPLSAWADGEFYPFYPNLA